MKYLVPHSQILPFTRTSMAEVHCIFPSLSHPFLSPIAVTSNISQGHSEAATFVRFGTFGDFFFKFCFNVQTCYHIGRVCVHFLKSVTKGHFRYVWVGGAG